MRHETDPQRCVQGRSRCHIMFFTLNQHSPLARVCSAEKICSLYIGQSPASRQDNIKFSFAPPCWESPKEERHHKNLKKQLNNNKIGGVPLHRTFVCVCARRMPRATALAAAHAAGSHGVSNSRRGSRFAVPDFRLLLPRNCR